MLVDIWLLWLAGVLLFVVVKFTLPLWALLLIGFVGGCLLIAVWKREDCANDHHADNE